MEEKRIFIFTGYYGSGKTEVATNFALKIRKKNKKVAIADMDVVNPYFRVREKREMLNDNDIKVIAPPKRIDNVDLPVLTAQLNGILDQDNYKVVLDLGGDDLGTTPLGSIKTKLKIEKYELSVVVNINRPFTEDEKGINKMIRMVENVGGLKVDSLISNTHLKEETSKEMIIRGAEIVKEVANNRELTFKMITIPNFLNSEKFISSLRKKFNTKVMELGLIYKTPWSFS